MSKPQRELSYGEDVVWGAGDLAAFRIYNQLTGDQARRIAAWNRAYMRGAAIGPRPVTIPAQCIADTARGLAAAAAA